MRHADYATSLYPQELALTSPTSGGRSVGIVRSRTQATEFIYRVYNCHILFTWIQDFFVVETPFYLQSRGLRHELSSSAPTLRSWVRIPLRHGCLCVFCVRFSCFCIVSSETASRPKKRLMRTYHWISLFMSYIKSANYLIESK
jgi:hypothetical protein